jgi:glutathione peroxidase
MRTTPVLCRVPALVAAVMAGGVAWAADPATAPVVASATADAVVPGAAGAPVVEPAGPAKPGSALDFTMIDLDGKPYPLAQHRGEVVLLVNVASHCGYTPQYAGLEALYAKYHAQGFEVIGIPANDFKAQEPGTAEEIRAFCTTKYHVTFPLMAKTTVIGPDICPLYKYLTEQGPHPAKIGWNFTKFLIGRDGSLIARWDSKVKPDDPLVANQIEALLALSAPATRAAVAPGM